MRLVFPTGIHTALFAGLLLGGLAVAVAQQPSDQSAPPQSAPQTDQQLRVGEHGDVAARDLRRRGGHVSWVQELLPESEAKPVR